MSWYFTDHVNGADIQTNFPGKDEVGISLTGGVYDHSELTLTKEGAFEGLCEGQIIYLFSDTGDGQEAKWGWYEITNVVSDDVIEIAVANTFGDPLTQDVNDVQSSDGPFQTIGKALDTVAAGDKVWVKKGIGPTAAYDDEHNGSGAVGEIQTKGTSSLPITFEGYRYRIGDCEGHWEDIDYHAVLDATLLDHALTTSFGEDDHHYVMKHFGCLGGGDRPLEAQDMKKCDWIDVWCDGGDAGSYIGEFSFIIGCGFENVGGGDDGVRFDDYVDVFGLVVRNNAGRGAYFGAWVNTVDGVLAYGNGDDAVEFNNTGAYAQIIQNSTIDGNGHIGIDANGSRVISRNNIVFNCSTGLDFHAVNQQHTLIHTLFAGCTTSVNNKGDIIIEIGTIDLGAEADEDDVGFLDIASGDYRLKYSSPARGAGWPGYVDIGAHQRRELATHGPTNVGMQT